MRSVSLCIFTLVALLAAPGCADKDKTPREGSKGTHAPVTAESEVKPAPPAAPPAAVAPPVAATSLAAAHGRPASPAEQTKEALEPKPPQTAVLTPAKIPAAPPAKPATPASAPAIAPENARQPEPAGQDTRQAAEAPQPQPTETAALAPAKPVSPTPEPQAKEPSATTAKEAKDTGAKPTTTGKASGPAVAVVGDSLAVGVGMTMEQHLKPQEGLGCLALGKVSTGLISKRKLDWEKRMADLVAAQKPAVVVVVMGGNDANNGIGGKMAGTPEWGAAYRQKVEHFVRIATSSGVKVLWVGLPAMRDAAYAVRVRAVNAAAKEACAAVSGCTYMEAGDTFVDASGNYVQAKDIGGKQVTLRGKDGVHMTMAGYDLLCRQVLDKLDKNGDLPHAAK